MIKVALDNKAVKAVQKAIGGGQGGNDNPCEVKTGRKLTIDLSQDVFKIAYPGHNLENVSDLSIGFCFSEDIERFNKTYYKNKIYPLVGYDYETVINIWITKNEQNNQLLMEICGHTGGYITLHQPVVIYEGDVSNLDNTESIMDQLPVVTLTLNEDDFSFIDYLTFDNCKHYFVDYDGDFHIDVE